MIRRTLYLIFGVAVLAGATMADLRGVAFGGVRQQRVGPRSVRENPGGYRPVYRSSVRYRHGK